MIYLYPRTISEAAQTLDKYDKDWASKINKSILNMTDGENCILGQLLRDEVELEDGCDTHYQGLKLLFGIDTINDENDLYQNDTIFGKNASKLDWEIEINKRDKYYDIGSDYVRGTTVIFVCQYGEFFLAQVDYCKYQPIGLSSGQLNRHSNKSIELLNHKVTKNQVEKLLGFPITDIYRANIRYDRVNQ